LGRDKKGDRGGEGERAMEEVPEGEGRDGEGETAETGKKGGVRGDERERERRGEETR
jgi:hypothetical protein